MKLVEPENYKIEDVPADMADKVDMNTVTMLIETAVEQDDDDIMDGLHGRY